MTRFASRLSWGLIRSRAVAWVAGLAWVAGGLAADAAAQASSSLASPLVSPLEALYNDIEAQRAREAVLTPDSLKAAAQTPETAGGARVETVLLASGNDLIRPTRIYVDRSEYPHRMALIDSGNSRVLFWRRMDRFHLGLSADVVLGQSAADATPVEGGVYKLERPGGVALAPTGELFVTDRSRVLIYRPPLYSGMPGFIQFGSSSAGATSVLLRNPSGLALDSWGTLWVVDTGNHRVMAYHNAVQKPPGAPADLVIGQEDFIASTANSGQARPNAFGFNTPLDVAVDDEGHLYVADWGDHRVLRFTAPHTSGMSADYVYGQRNPYDFTSAIPNNGGISPATLNGPLGLEWIERGWLLVTDNANQRVLRFQTGGAAPSISADLAVSSQASPQSIIPIPFGQAPGGSLRNPFSANADAQGRIFVVDPDSNRLVRYDNVKSPGLLEASLIDGDANGEGTEGETLLLTFPDEIHLTAPMQEFSESDFALSGAGGSLGAGFFVEQSQADPRKLAIRLGADAMIHTIPPGGVREQATWINLGASISQKVYDAKTLEPLAPAAPRPVKVLFREVQRMAKPGGAAVTLASDGSARFSRHSISIPATAVSPESMVLIAPPADDYGFDSVVEVSADSSAQFTMEFAPSQVDLEAGQIFKALKFVVIYGEEPPYNFTRFSGKTTYDTVNNTITARLGDLGNLPWRRVPRPSVGIPKEVIGGLPELVVDPREIFVSSAAPAPAAMRTRASEILEEASPPPLTLMPGPEGLYTRHRIEFPGFVEDPSGKRVTLRQAQGYERYTFPENSGSIFAVESKPLLPADAPINIEIEFMDSEQLELTDLRTFDGVRGSAGKLRLVQFDITLPGFVPVSSTRYSKIYLLDRSTIRVEGLKSFTLTSPEIYGVVIDPAAEELAVTKPSGAGQATPAPTETPGPSPTPSPSSSATPQPTQTPATPQHFVGWFLH